jgi:cytoskeleton protein RodZ
MSDASSSTPPNAASAATHNGQAGPSVRAAREARGQSLQHLSVLLKISERRLQAFEEERWSEVGDRTFIRALAQRLCRHLGLDPQPILQSLPAPVVEPMRSIDRSASTLAGSLSASGTRRLAPMDDRRSGAAWFTPVRAGVAVILLAAGALALLPADTWGPTTEHAPPAQPTPSAPSAEPAQAAAPEGAASAPAEGAAVAPAVVVASEPAAVSPAVQAVAAMPMSAAAGLQLTARQDTWVQVSDAKGVVLMSRLLRSGETVGVEGARPLRLRVGNAAGTEARWLGRVVPLEDVQRNNVADVELP